MELCDSLWNLVSQWNLLAGGSPISDDCRSSKSCLPAQGSRPFVSRHLPPGLSPSLDGFCPVVGVERTFSTWEVAFAPEAWAALGPGMRSLAEGSSVLWTESGGWQQAVTDSLSPMWATRRCSVPSGPLEDGLVWWSSQLYSGWPALVFTLCPSLSHFFSFHYCFLWNYYL